MTSTDLRTKIWRKLHMLDFVTDFYLAEVLDRLIDGKKRKMVTVFDGYSGTYQITFRKLKQPNSPLRRGR